MKSSIVSWSFAVLASVVSGSVLPKRQAEYSDYVLAHFVGQGTANEEQIYFTVTNDNDLGSWTAANGGAPVLISDVGTRGVRDPSLIRSQDGSTVWLIATDLSTFNNGGNYDTETGSLAIVVWTSTDGMASWSAAALHEISPSNAGMTWAPDATWDPEAGQYLISWTCNLKGEGWFIMKTYTSDFTSFSTAEKFLTGAGMDITIQQDPASGNFYRFGKNGPNEAIEQASAPSLCNDCWQVVAQSIGYPDLPAGEGPLVFPDNGNPGVWHLWIDDYTRGAGYQAFTTNDITSGQWTRASYETAPRGRHGYMLGITAEEKANLLG